MHFEHSEMMSPPSYAQDFKFKIFSGKGFERVRRTIGISNAAFIASVTGIPEDDTGKVDGRLQKVGMSYALRVDETHSTATAPRHGGDSTIDYSSFVSKCATLEMSTNSKSGSFFFYTADMKYIIKTIGKDEKRLMVENMKDFVLHWTQNPDSLLNTVCGLFSMGTKGKPDTPFVVLRNIFPIDDTQIDEVYDLKGSTFGRKASAKDRASAVTIYKDLDFCQSEEQLLSMSPETRTWFLSRLRDDVAFLRERKIIDYSLLLGIHFGGGSDNCGAKVHGEPGVGAGSVHMRADGGIYGQNGDVYYCSVIDFLIRYETRKILEANTRGAMVNAKHGKGALSVQNPVPYAQRLVQFITSKTPMSQHRVSFFSPSPLASTSRLRAAELADD